MLSPVIMIGCGGSGSKAIRYVRYAVKRKLHTAGWPDDIPAAWSFIGVDTLSKQEGGDADEIPDLPKDDFVQITKGLSDYSMLNEALLTMYPTNDPSYQHLIGWRPDPDQVQIAVETGCGQIRAIGRAVGLYTLQRSLGKRISDAFDRAQAGSGLKEVSATLGKTRSTRPSGDQTDKPPLVVVCASLGGGTGAGIALDVIDMLRRTSDHGKDAILVLFSIDIFGRSARDMAGNSLAMLSEVLASYWKMPSEPGAGDVFGQLEGRPGHGPKAVFVVGSQSMQGATIGSSKRDADNLAVTAYRSVGEVLSTWVVDESVQELASHYSATNWANQRHDTAGGYGFGATEQQPGMVSSFGAATITLGREHFSAWAADLLARQTIGELVEGHLRSDQSGTGGDERTDSERILHLAERNLWRLFDAKDRTNREHRADSPVDVPSLYDEIISHADASAVESKFREPLSDSDELPGREWQSNIHQELNLIWEWVEEQGSRSIDYDKLNSVAKSFPQAVCQAVTEIIADTSIPVAIEVLKQAKAQAASYVEERLSATVRDCDKCEKRYDDVRSRLNTRRKLKYTHDDCAVCVDAAVSYLEALWDERRHWEIKDVIDSACNHVYEEIIRGLSRDLRVLAENMRKEPVKSWPNDAGDRPVSYLPGPLEFALEDPECWPGMLESICKKLDGYRPGRDPLDMARRVLIRGCEDGEIDLPAGLRHSSGDRGWFPSDGSGITITSELVRDGIVNRTRTLMNLRAFRGVIDEGLRQYLGDPQKGDHTNRLKRFETCLGDALSLSLPLVQLDKDLCQKLYKDKAGPEAVNRVCSAFPFDAGHPAFDIAKTALGDHYRRVSAGDPPSVMISSVMEYPLHPIAVSSLMHPIAEAVQRCKTADSLQAGFWNWRRGRTLPSFVPVPAEVRRALICGFAIGRMCGYVTADTKKAVKISGTPKALGSSETVTFPWPLLSEVRDPRCLLPALLESFVLCIAKAAADHEAAFEPYARLYDLGKDLEDAQNSELHSLIRNGDVPRAQVDEPKVRGHDECERMTAAENYLKPQIEFLKQLEVEPFKGDEWCTSKGIGSEAAFQSEGASSLVPVRELLPEMRECFEHILSSLRKDRRAEGYDI